MLAATLYKLAMLPLALAGFALVPVAILFGVRRKSRIEPEREIYTAPDWLSLYGNEQDGFDPEWAVATIYKGWPVFLRRYSWAAWRNKIRNVAFVPSLQWLHKPPDELMIFDIKYVFGVRVEVWWRGWMTEIRAGKGRWFLDIGPRLDQPDLWGAVSWAFRVNGRL